MGCGCVARMERGRDDDGRGKEQNRQAGYWVSSLVQFVMVGRAGCPKTCLLLVLAAKKGC